MTDRNRKSPPEESRDRLENYGPLAYRDTLEQALSEETVAAIQSRPYACVSPDTTVEQALHLLTDLGVACALVEEDGKLVGVFADRDVLNKVALEYETIKHRPVRDVMMANPVYIHESDPPAAILCVMAVMGHRHVPVLDRNHRILGIVTPQRMTTFLLDRVDA